MEDITPKTDIDEEEEEEEEEEVKKIESEKVEEKESVDIDEEKRGGIITHLISNLASPASPKPEDRGDEDSGRNGGGVMNSLITNLFHHSEEEREDQRKRKREDENGKVGIIENIVSHFPTSISEDAVPTTDEASILINSIVKD